MKMKLAPQTVKCFTSGCSRTVIVRPLSLAPVDTSNWMREARFGWLADVDRWYCPSCFARINYVRQQLPIAIQELHAYSLIAGLPMLFQGETVNASIRDALSRVAALRSEEYLFFPTEASL